jgi:outer membrane protein assembly factor BamB
MRAGSRSLWQEERGVSVVIGAILMLLIVVAMWGIIQAFHVPNWNKDVEYEHLNIVHDDMMTFKSDVEDVALSGEPKSSDFHMGVRYPNRMFLANPGTGVAGSLTSDTVPISIVYTIDAPGDPVITQNYSSNRISYEVQGTVDSPKLVYEHGVIIRDYGNEYATTDEQSLIVGDEIFIPVLTGNLTASSSMETESIALKPLPQSPGSSKIKSVIITIDTLYPEVWTQLLAGKSTAATTVQIVNSQIVIHSTAVRQIYFPEGEVITDALYAGMISFSTTIVPEPAFIIGGGTGSVNLQGASTNYVPMFNSNRSAVESEVQQFMPVAGTVSNFYVILDGSPGTSRWYTFVVRKNGADTPLTCTIADTDTTGSDLTNSVSFAAGDYISIMSTPSAANPTGRSMLWTAKFSPSLTVSTTPPSVTTDDATNITTTGARLNGNLTSMGTATSVSVFFQWGTSPGVYPNTTMAQVMSATGTFYFDLTGLTPGTTYYFRAQADGDGTAYGSEKSFTVSTTPPAVTTNAATNITTTGARLNGNLTSMGTATSVSVSFEWGTSPGVYPNTTTAQVMSATGTFYFDLIGLNPGTTYYFRAQADGDGTAYGSELSFTTSVTSTITASAGTNGTISPSGAVIVTYGASQTFTMKPNTGYYIATLTVDGSPVTPAPTYTFTDVTANHTISVTFASNSNVYAFQGNGQTAFWVYSISGNSWTALTSAPAAVGDGGSLVYDGANSIYAFQGNNLTGFWRYNISSNTWTTLAAAPANVSSGGALQFDGGNYVYAFRGNNTNTFWRYDISGNSWTTMANAPNSVRYGGSLAYDGGNYMYALRGNNNNRFWRYDISGDSWTTMANTPASVRYGGSLAYDGGNYMYAFRGNNTNTFWRYDISGNSWLALTSALASVNSGGALAYPGFNYLYAFRGANSQTFWRYSISGNSWVAMTNAPANVNSGCALTSGK